MAGRVRSMRVQPWGGNPALECAIADETGSVVVIFFGRRELGGVRLGTLLRVEVVVGEYRGRRSILNRRLREPGRRARSLNWRPS